METDKYQKYEKAVKYARGFREFYKHLVTYLVFVVVLLIFKTRIVYFVQVNSEQPDPELLAWVHANIFWIPIIWGAAVLMQGLYVYRHKFLFFNGWEDRKVKELMEEEEQKNTQLWE